MVKKQRRMRTSLRSASKVQERGLAESAERLANHPEWAVPRCEGHRDHFARARKHAARVAGHADDAEKLGKLARRGHPYARAYAATLLVGLHDPEGVVMQNVKTPWGMAAIAVRGSAKPMHLVAMQHLSDRKLRAFLVIDIAKKKKLTFYSMPEGAGALLVCAGKDGKPPEAFVRDAAASLSLMKDPQGWGCPHAVQQ
ncbi:MAG: hypothetical protein LC624_03855, partial [Halobacteriales archaeon]|nr:hypothetical protein [Halobacteriales archaeon]